MASAFYQLLLHTGTRAQSQRVLPIPTGTDTSETTSERLVSTLQSAQTDLVDRDTMFMDAAAVEDMPMDLQHSIRTVFTRGKRRPKRKRPETISPPITRKRRGVSNKDTVAPIGVADDQVHAKPPHSQGTTLQDLIAKYRWDTPSASTDISTQDAKTLQDAVLYLSKKDALQTLDADLLLSLMENLRHQLERNITTLAASINAACTNKTVLIDVDDVSASKSLLDIANAKLRIMGTTDMDPRVVSDESLDQCVDTLKWVVESIILPVIDKDSLRKLQTQVKTQRSDNKTVLPKVFSNATKRALDGVVPMLSETMDGLALVLDAVKVPERTATRLAWIVVDLFALDRNSSSGILQQNGLSLLRSVIVRHPSTLPQIQNLVLHVFLHQPTTKRSLRKTKLTDSELSVHTTSMLLVAVVQSCVCIPLDKDTSTSESTSNSQGQSWHVEALGKAQAGARNLVGLLLTELFQKQKQSDIPTRQLLDSLTDDLLVMCTRPEWAGAELLLEILSASLAHVVNTDLTTKGKKLEPMDVATALQAMGKICARLKTFQKQTTEDIRGDTTVSAVLDEHERFLLDDRPRQLDHAESVAWKHVVLVYLERRFTSNAVHEDARKLLLLRYMEKSPTCTPSNISFWQSLWSIKKSSRTSRSRLLLPTPDVLSLMNMQLLLDRPLGQLFDKLLSHVVAPMSSAGPSLRSRVLKVLSDIVDVDPMLMANDGIHSCVRECFYDSSTSVRHAVVELVGTYTNMQPVLLSSYVDLLLDRIRDKGVSVRKSVCKLFRTFLLSPTYHQAMLTRDTEERIRKWESACTRTLVERLGDPLEVEEVKDFVIDMFRELWFGSDLSRSELLSSTSALASDSKCDELPPGWTRVDVGKASTPSISSYMSPEGRVADSPQNAWAAFRCSQEQHTDVSDHVPHVVTSIVHVAHQVGNIQWLGQLLDRVMNGIDVSFPKPNVVSRPQQLVDAIVECLLRLEEGSALSLLGVDEHDSQVLACLLALCAFSEANPSLLVKHVRVLMVYVGGDDNLSKANEAKVQSVVISMLEQVLDDMTRIPPRIVTKLETDMKDLVFKAPPSVVGPAIKCLALLPKKTNTSPTLLFSMLDVFYACLQNFEPSDTPISMTPSIDASVQRALFCASQFVSAIDLDEHSGLEPDRSDLEPGNITQSLYKVYTAYLVSSPSPRWTTKAVQGLSFLFIARPRLLLEAHEDRILEMLLRSGSEDVATQCLTSIQNLLQVEEERLADASSPKRLARNAREQVAGDRDGDASLVGSVMQAQLHNILSLALHPSTHVRSEAAGCLSKLLTQGLVGPFECIPTLVALASDKVVANRELAQDQLGTLHAKFPKLLATAAVDGIRRSFTFQSQAFALVSPFVDEDPSRGSVFGQLYSNCLRTPRSQRNLFLKAVLNQFAIKQMPSTTEDAVKRLDYLSYLTHLLSSLPYALEDEPLFLIYHINRFVTLHASNLLETLKQEFADLGIAPELMQEREPDLSDVDIDDYASTAPNLRDSTRLQSLHALPIGMLLGLKVFLKSVYLVENERCQTYRPQKEASQPTVLADATQRLELPRITLDVKTCALDQVWSIFMYTWDAVRMDSQEIDFEMTQDAATRRKRGRRKLVSEQKTEHDE